MADSAEKMREAEIGRCYKIGHDGFVGTVIGHYTTIEGKEGVVLQQVGTRVVHVYGRKWIDEDAALSASGTKSEIDEAGLERAVRECARITAPEITDAEYEAIRKAKEPRYLNTCAEMRRALIAYLGEAGEASTKPGPSDPIPSQPDERPVCKLCGLEDGACICRSIPKQPQPDEREAIAETIWRAEYRRATGRERSVPWSEVSSTDRERYRYVADNILAIQAERRGNDPLEDLVSRFAEALLAKLRLAQTNGRSGWDRNDWEEACRKSLMRHIEKGDPRDVAAYCAFMWHHGWSTATTPQRGPIAGLEPVASLLDELREYTALRYVGDCKCGNCQLVPRATLDKAIRTIARLEAHAAEQVRPLVEALEGLIEAVELDADEGLKGISGYTGARLNDAKNAIRARGQV